MVNSALISGPRACVLKLFLLSLSGLFFQGCGLFGIPRDLQPRGHALFYGITNYQSITDVYGGREDAEAMALLFGGQGYTTRLRTDSAATKAAVLADFADMKNLVTEDDTFIMFFAGHGAQFDKSGYEPGTAYPPPQPNHPDPHPLEYDTLQEVIIFHGFTSPDAPDPEMLLDDEIAALFKTIPAKRKLLILDSCHSGGFIGAGTGVDTTPRIYDNRRGWDARTLELLVKYYMEYTKKNGADVMPSDTIVISAAGEREFSYSRDELDHGVFTNYYLDTAEKGDADLDGYVTVTETYKYAIGMMQSLWNSAEPDRDFYPRISQSPADFILFRTEPR